MPTNNAAICVPFFQTLSVMQKKKRNKLRKQTQAYFLYSPWFGINISLEFKNVGLKQV